MTAHLCVLVHHRDPDRPRPAIVGGNVCAAHYRSLEQMIAEVPALDADLVRVHTATRGPQGEKVTSSRTPGLNIREDALDARTALRHVLLRWADHTAAARGFTRPSAAADLETVATFLVRNLPWIVRQTDTGWLPAQHEQLTDATRQARRVCQPAGRAHVVDVAPCPETIKCEVPTRALIPCPGILQVTFLPGDAHPNMPAPEIRCPACGARYESARWYALGKRILTTAGQR